MVNRKKTILAAIVILFLGGAAAYYLNSRIAGTACTLEAKLCPDGSYVGRTGPNCEFALCPAVTDLWEIFTDEERKISFRYPRELAAKYIQAWDWPPQIQILNEPFSCTEAGEEWARAGKTEKRTVEGRIYCRTKIVEGAAGSIYTLYAYAFPRDGKTAVFTFSTRAVQCGNYGESQKTECEKEREAFDLDGILDQIALSLFVGVE